MTQLAPPAHPKQASHSQQVAEKELDKSPTTTLVLDVDGMMCAGCVSIAEKKLAQCEGVVAATVNLVTAVAAVTCEPSRSAQAIAQKAAQTLTDAGYPSKVRAATDSGQNPMAAEADWLARQQQSQQYQTRQLVVALCLLIFSIVGHLQHFSWAQGISVPILSTLWFHGILATLTLLFPARKILIEGWQGAHRGAPNMNTLVSLGAISAYTTSLVALLFPALGWECFFDEPVMLLSFILLGRTLERRARFQAAGSLRSLIALQPTLARLIPPPAEDNPNSISDSTTDSPRPQTIPLPSDPGVQIPANQVQVGEWLRVLPSEKIPVDGVIATGQTTLDESMLTGESMPVVKQPGDEVVAGSLNQSGAITLRVSRTGLDTTLAKMIRLVETAQSRKAPIQRLADLISGYFTYGILTCSALTLAFWYWVGVPIWPEIAASTLGHMHHSMHPSAAIASAETVTQSLRLLVSLKLAIAVVVVACPCALGLATPTAILVGSGIGAQQGLLIRGGDILEATRGLDTIIFDKTGTLTSGHPHLTDCISLSAAHSQKQLLQIAATVESGTRHPLGLAIQQAAADKGIKLLSASDFQTKAGYGIAAQLAFEDTSRDIFYLGNRAWIEQNGCDVDSVNQQLASAWGASGKTSVFIAQANAPTLQTNSQLGTARGPKIIGLIGIADTLREDALSTVEKLRSRHLNVQLLSGDSTAAATAVARQLQLSPEQAQAEVTPAAKVDVIAALQKAGHRVGFVGDGINDAPALAQADVGIALGSGTEVAMETADIVLMRDALSDVIAVIDLSRATFNKIRQNLIWAFAYNLVCIPLAAGVFLPAFRLSLNPGFAGGLMALSSITVVLNSLLLKARFRSGAPRLT